VNIPSHAVKLPEKVPSKTLPEPQDSEFAFRMVSVQFASFAIFSPSSAPFSN